MKNIQFFFLSPINYFAFQHNGDISWGSFTLYVGTKGFAKKRMFAYEGGGGSLRSSTYACKKN